MTIHDMIQAQGYIRASMAVRSVMDMMMKDEQGRVLYADYWTLDSLAKTLEIKAKGLLHDQQQQVQQQEQGQEQNNENRCKFASYCPLYQGAGYTCNHQSEAEHYCGQYRKLDKKF